MNIVTAVSGVAGAVFGFLFGDLTPVFLWLVAFEVIDFISGIAAAAVEHNVDSELCYRGIIKKVFILALVAVGHGVDEALGITIAQSAVTFFYLASEGISIVENAARLGLPVPEKIVKILNQLRDKNDKEEE